MTNMIERVCNAITDARLRKLSPEEQARAAIVAMREPTDEMKDAFRIGAEVEIKAGQIISGKGWLHGWYAANDAALGLFKF